MSVKNKSRAVAVSPETHHSSKNLSNANKIGFTETVTYYNYTFKDIMVRRRDGLVIPARRGRDIGANRHAFVISVEYTIDSDITNKMLETLRYTKSNNPKFNIISDYVSTCLEMSKDNRYLFNTIEIAYTVTLKEIEDAGGSIYIPEIDLVIDLTEDPNAVALHPHSIEHRRLDEDACVQNDVGRPANRMGGIFYHIVDNNGVFGDRWINLAGQVFKVPACEDHKDANGVYVHGYSQARSRHHSVKDYRYYTFEEAEKELQLFKTFDQALHHEENEKARLSLEEKKLELKNNEIKNIIQAGKNENDLAKNIHDKEKIKSDRDKLVLDRAYRKYEHERKMEEEKLTVVQSHLKSALEFSRSVFEICKYLSPILIAMFTASTAKNGFRMNNGV